MRMGGIETKIKSMKIKEVESNKIISILFKFWEAKIEY